MSRYWRALLLAVVLLGIWLAVGTVSATEIPIFTNATHESPVGVITNAKITGSTIYVSWENIPPLGEGDQAGVISLYCSDAWQPYWGGMAYGAGGTWDFTLSDIDRTDVDGCWFDLINGEWELI